MKPALETVVRSSPAVWSAYPSASSRPSEAPATQPGLPRAPIRPRAGTASTAEAIRKRTARNANSG